MPFVVGGLLLVGFLLFGLDSKAAPKKVSPVPGPGDLPSPPSPVPSPVAPPLVLPHLGIVPPVHADPVTHVIAGADSPTMLTVVTNDTGAKGALNVRSGPNTSFASRGTVPHGGVVRQDATIVNSEGVSTVDPAHGWIEITDVNGIGTPKGVSGFCAALFLQIVPGTGQDVAS